MAATNTSAMDHLLMECRNLAIFNFLGKDADPRTKRVKPALDRGMRTLKTVRQTPTNQ